ncbi:sigma factor-like helix-turn-helix DNA-binding protein [Modestobacter sp. SSW1-42]|uniref:sigma factor-like helix-turn-helix DNA-binding protein n=1 Tax=Modestobacter sp. SSW1-42 TaxID=596372 RepID=UPI003985FFFD
MRTTDDGAFAAFVADQAPALLRTAVLLTGDPTEAVELASAALGAVHRRWGELAAADRAPAARAALLAEHPRWHRRTQLREAVAATPLLRGLSLAPVPAPPVRSALTTALGRLPAQQRAVLVLRLGEGRSVQQTAADLGVPEESVASDTLRGLDRVEELLPADDRPAAGVETALRTHLAGRTAAVPQGFLAGVLDGVSTRRRHWAGLAAVAAFFVLVVVLVLLTTR